MEPPPTPPTSCSAPCTPVWGLSALSPDEYLVLLLCFLLQQYSRHEDHGSGLGGQTCRGNASRHAADRGLCQASGRGWISLHPLMAFTVILSPGHPAWPRPCCRKHKTRRPLCDQASMPALGGFRLRRAGLKEVDTGGCFKLPVIIFSGSFCTSGSLYNLLVASVCACLCFYGDSSKHRSVSPGQMVFIGTRLEMFDAKSSSRTSEGGRPP